MKDNERTTLFMSADANPLTTFWPNESNNAQNRTRMTGRPTPGHLPSESRHYGATTDGNHPPETGIPCAGTSCPTIIQTEVGVPIVCGIQRKHGSGTQALRWPQTGGSSSMQAPVTTRGLKIISPQAWPDRSTTA